MYEGAWLCPPSHSPTPPTSRIATAIDEVLRPQGMGVVNQADHSGKPLHGVDAPGTSLTTRALLGGVREDARAPEEFLRLVRG